ncbi:MAG TPA: hypothetical protein VGL71_10770 [Urbifossiella sp.]
MIRLICPGCDKTLQVNDNLAGRAVACPSCKTKFQVPQAEPPDDEPPSRKPAPPPRNTTTKPSSEADRDPPRRKPRDDDDDDDRPRSRRRDNDEDDEDDDRPRRRRRDLDDDDDDDDDDRPRSRAKKKKKRRARSGGDGGGFSSWSISSKVVSISAAFCFVCLLFSFLWPPIFFAALGLSYILMFAGGIGMLIVAFNDDVMQGILCLLVPFYSLYYLITHFEECKQPFLIQIGGLLLMMFMFCAGVGLIAALGNNAAPFPMQKAELGVLCRALPPTMRA